MLTIKKEDFTDFASVSVLFAAGIFLVALLSAVIGAVSISFIWTGQRFSKIEGRLDKLEAGQARLTDELKEIKALLLKRP